VGTAHLWLFKVPALLLGHEVLFELPPFAFAGETTDVPQLLPICKVEGKLMWQCDGRRTGSIAVPGREAYHHSE
jgi:hypothetical protein